jgi:Ni/Co efflux regulator RcnB
MKKLLFIICSVAMMSLCSLAQAQEDTTSTDYNARPQVEERDDNTQSDDMKTEDAERTDDQQEQSSDQELQNDVDAMQENFEGSTIDKVGPNGEKLYMEHGKYFYFDDEGRKVKVKKSEVRDKA